MKLPTKEECLKILEKAEVPANIIAHTSTVCDFSMKVIDLLEKKGIKVNRNLVAAAALLHDLKKMASDRHEIDGAEHIKQLGYPEVGRVISKHGLANLNKEELIPKTWEEKILFYSDKRVNGDKVVTVDERFEYIKQRYKKEGIEKEIEFTKKIEKELLGNEKI